MSMISFCFLGTVEKLCEKVGKLYIMQKEYIKCLDRRANFLFKNSEVFAINIIRDT